jgi:rubrerythrin
MTESQTVENLLDLSSAIEKEMITFYCYMRQMFSHMPVAKDFWIKLRDDEIEHITQLYRIKQSLTYGQLSAPADSSMIEKAGRVLGYISPDQWENIENLDDAVELANKYENSEANQIFLFLAERYIPSAARKEMIETIVNDHLERLISLPAEIDTHAARKRILSKQLQ